MEDELKKELKTLKLVIEKARESVKKNKKAFKVAKGSDKEKYRARALKTAQTKLANAEKAYKAAKPNSAFTRKGKEIKEGVANKINFKKWLGYTGIAIFTTVAGIVTFIIVDKCNADGEEVVEDTM